MLVKIVTFFLIGMAVLASLGFGQEPAAAPTDTAPPVELKLSEWQYRVTTPVYEAIVAPSGLLSYLEVGHWRAAFLDRPLRLNVHPDRFGKKPQYICPRISQPEPDVLVCDGPQATLRYAFGHDGGTIEYCLGGKFLRRRAVCAIMLPQP